MNKTPNKAFDPTTPNHSSHVSKNWARFFYFFWIYTLLVIAWGAWVRISNSGNGCGDHWPLCGGEFIPSFEDKKTLTEYFHRLMTGTYGLVVIWFYFKIRKHSDSYIKKINLTLLILMLIEALIGAMLVKLQLVTENDSYLRLFVMIIHQGSSFLLSGLSYLAYKYFAIGSKWKFERLHFWFLLIAMSGAIAALATTLFPSESLWEGIVHDFSQYAHPFIRLRILHPLLALALMGGYAFYSLYKEKYRRAILLFILIGLGIITLLTLSPVPLKVAHLMMAHIVWALLLTGLD